MQRPFEASLSDLTETESVPHAISETHSAGDSGQQTACSTDTSLSNAETLQLFSQLLDVKFDPKIAGFKRDLEDKAATQSQVKNLHLI